MLRGDAAMKAMGEGEERPGHTKGKYSKESASALAAPAFSAPRDWEKFVTGVMGPKTLLTGVCLLPIMRDRPADNRRSVMCVPTHRTRHPPHMAPTTHHTHPELTRGSLITVTRRKASH